MDADEDPEFGILRIDVIVEEVVLVVTVDEFGNITQFYDLRTRSQVTRTYGMDENEDEDVVVDLHEDDYQDDSVVEDIRDVDDGSE